MLKFMRGQSRVIVCQSSISKRGKPLEVGIGHAFHLFIESFVHLMDLIVVGPVIHLTLSKEIRGSEIFGK